MCLKTIFKTTAATILVGIALTLTPSPSAAEKAPRFWISNLENKRFISKRHKGGIIISFFFVDCIPCKKEVPRLYKLVTDEKPDVKLMFIDSEKNDTKARIREFATRKQVPLSYFYHDSMGRLAKKFFGKKMKYPAIVGIKNGEIQFKLFKLGQAEEKKIVAMFGK